MHMVRLRRWFGRQGGRVTRVARPLVCLSHEDQRFSQHRSPCRPRTFDTPTRREGAATRRRPVERVAASGEPME